VLAVSFYEVVGVLQTYQDIETYKVKNKYTRFNVAVSSFTFPFLLLLLIIQCSVLLVKEVPRYVERERTTFVGRGSIARRMPLH
jgi:hypothetical protein